MPVFRGNLVDFFARSLQVYSVTNFLAKNVICQFNCRFVILIEIRTGKSYSQRKCISKL